MPVRADPNLKGQIGLGFNSLVPREAADVTLGDQMGAAFELDNIVVSAAVARREDPLDFDPDFDVLEHLTPRERLSASRFAAADSLLELQEIRKQREREEQARRYLDQGPVPAILASAVAILADPTTYVPIGGAVGGGAKLSTRIARTGAFAAAETAAGELALQSLQETRSTSESMAAVLLGAAFGTGIGAIAGTLSARQARAFQDDLAEAADEVVAVATDQFAEYGFPARVDPNADLRFAEYGFPPGAGRVASEPPSRAADADPTLFPDPGVDVPDPFAEFGPGSGGSVGAATVRRDTESTLLAGGPVVGFIARKLGQFRGFAAPSLELATSRLPAAREAVAEMVDTGLVTKGNAVGLHSPVALETRIKSHTAVVSDAFGLMKTGHAQHRKKGGNLGFAEFRAEVGRSMRRGDESAIPEVQRLAREMRNKVFEPYKKEAIRLGLLPEDVTVDTAMSYFTRVYKRGMLRDASARAAFRRRVVDWLRKTGRANEFEGLADMESLAEDIIDTILGSPAGRVPLVGAVPKVRGPFKERTFSIPDEMIEEFLESDVLVVAAQYVRTMAADIETTRVFGRLDAQDVAARIQDEARSASAAAEKAGKTRVANSILAEGERQARLVQELLNEIRGVRGGPFDPSYTFTRRVLKTGRDLNYLRLLGSVLVSSIPDVGRVVMEEGLTRAFGGLVGDMMTGFKGIRLGVAEARAAGTALDLINGQRAAALFDISDRFLAATKFERGVDTGARLFGRLTLMDAWNTALKGWTSMVAGTRLLSTVDNLALGRRVSQRDMTKLAQSGIDPEMARRIASQKDNWEVYNGSVLPNTEAWTDRGAAHAYRNAILRDVDNTIITPGAGDAPLWTSTEWGKTVFQFKRFGMASTQRVLLSGLQTRDMATLNGMALMVALGAAGTAIRDTTFETSDKPLGEVRPRSNAQWVADAIDRAGIASMLFEMDNMAEKATGVGAVSSITGKEVSRFAGRDLLGQVFGPTAGLAEDMASATTNALKADFTRPDLHKLRKLFPAQNLFYLRGLLDRAEKATGLPERNPRLRRKRPSFR